ncbi:MAG: 50S ribosomal protein L32e [Candidatus Woesearchaeota archaeon]
MMSIKELLEIRKRIKSKKPHFIRQDTHKKKRLHIKWRKPKGLHSKIRLEFRGRAKNVSAGYRSPKKVRYLHKSGLQQCLVKSMRDLENLDSKKNCIILSSSLGDKKRITILKKAIEGGFIVLNIKNPGEYIKKAEEKIDLRRKEKKEKESEKKEKTATKGKQDEKLAEKVEGEEKKEAEKKEKDKILTKKEK